MAAGREASQTAADINGTVGGICAELDYVFDRIMRVQLFMAATDLTAAPYSMTAGDQTSIKSAMTDLDQLRQVYQGLAVRTPAYDYRTFVKLLIGIPTN